MKTILITIFALMASGCMASPWVFVAPGIEGSTVAGVSNPSFAKVITESERSHTILSGLNQKVFITSVDGKSTQRLLTTGLMFPEGAYLPPGRRYLGLLYGQLNTTARGAVWFDAEAGKDYVVRRELKGYSIFFWVEELNTGKVVGGIPGSEPEVHQAAPYGT